MPGSHYRDCFRKKACYKLFENSLLAPISRDACSTRPITRRPSRPPLKDSESGYAKLKMLTEKALHFVCVQREISRAALARRFRPQTNRPPYAPPQVLRGGVCLFPLPHCVRPFVRELPLTRHTVGHSAHEAQSNLRRDVPFPQRKTDRARARCHSGIGEGMVPFTSPHGRAWTLARCMAFTSSRC